MRKLILNLHLYGSLLCGVFLIILGVTGSIMAFEEDLDRLFNPRLLVVEARPPALPVVSIQHTLEKAYPGQRFLSLRLPSNANAPMVTQIGSKQIFVNGYTGEILGERQTPTALGKIHQLHTSLMAGKTGARIMTYSTAVSIFLILSGVYLWWPYKIATVKAGEGCRGLNFQLHNAAGIYFSIFLLVLSGTGVVIGFDSVFSPWIFKITHSAPPPRNFKSGPATGTPIDTDEAIRVAKTALPDASPTYVFSPKDAQASYQVFMRFPGDLTAGRSRVNVDQYSGKPLFVESSRKPPAGTGILMVNRGLHTGDIYGYPTKILMSFSCLVLVAQVITGYCIWWKKLRTKNNRQTEKEEAATA